jgi:hypothetical protein
MSSDSLADASAREYYASLLRQINEAPLRSFREKNLTDYAAVRVIVREWVYNPYVITLVKRDSLVTVTLKLVGDESTISRTGLQNLELTYSSTAREMLALYSQLRDKLVKYDFYNSFDDKEKSTGVSTDGNAYVLEYDGPYGHLVTRGRRGNDFRGSEMFFTISEILHRFIPGQILPDIGHAQVPSDLLFPVLKE